MPSEIQFKLISPDSQRIDRATDVGAGPDAAQRAEGGGFGQQLGQAMQTLDKLQVDADGQADAIAQGGGNLHEVALAFEKADVAMRLATRVRNKLVDAYNDVMKMSV